MSQPSLYWTTGKAAAQRLREIADSLDLVRDISPTSMTVSFQVVSHEPDVAGRITAIDTLAAAFGLVAETKRMSNRTFHRSTDQVDGVQVFGAVPEPAAERRAALLAELAKLDAETAPVRDTTDPGSDYYRTEDAGPETPAERKHSPVAGYGGNLCSPCRSGWRLGRCEDLTCSCRCRAADFSAPDAPELPAEDAGAAAISDERVAEILAELNSVTGLTNAEIGMLDEFGRVTQRNTFDSVLAFTLTDGSEVQFMYGADGAKWRVTR